jgi:hypothetical protein
MSGKFTRTSTGLRTCRYRETGSRRFRDRRGSPACIIAPPPVVVDEYPVYAAPRVYAAPPAYAYAGPAWRDGWGHRRHFRGRW